MSDSYRDEDNARRLGDPTPRTKPTVGSEQPGTDLAWIFTYHPPDEGDVEKYNALRNAAHQFAQVVLENTPPGADQSAAVRKIREAVMTSNAAVALKGRLTCD